MAKFTFKTEKEKGRFSSFQNPTHHIKLEGKKVGNIDHDTWRIRLMIYDQDLIGTNCEWKWIKLAHISASLEEAKTFLLKVQTSIELKYKLHKSE